MKRWVLFPVLVLACAVAQAEFYRWVDANNEVHYSDQPPPANIKQFEKIKAAGGKPGEAPLPYLLQQAMKNFPVTLYVTGCGDPCTRGQELLARRGIPYAEMDATDPATQEELRKLTGGALEVPVLKIGSQVLRGFAADKWNSSLDTAGYPQTAVIPPRPPTRPSKPAATPAAPAAEASQ